MNHRYDFIYLFDAADANPNGDPDAGNLPRIDAESGQGLITDVCLKRKVRNFVEVVKKDAPGHDIYVKEKAVLIRAHERPTKPSRRTVNSKARPRPASAKAAAKKWNLHANGCARTSTMSAPSEPS